MISRAVVLLPQPVSPTIPSVSPRRTSKLDAVDRLHRADLALEDDPARDREVLDEVAHLDQRRRRALAVPSAPRERRGSALDAGAPRQAGLRDADAPARACCPALQLAPTGARRTSASSRHATWCVGSPGTGCELRIDARVVGLRVGAARMEVAARRRVDQARRRARDRHELLLARAVERRDRLQQPPRVGVLGARRTAARPTPSRRSARRT